MSAPLEFRVYGTPAPQGSKNARAIYKGRGADRVFTGKVALVESSAKVKPWREVVATAAAMHIAGIDGFQQLLGPVAIHVRFVLPRLKSHYGTGRNTEVLKASAPVFQAVYPDADKLSRGVLDAITTSGIWKDDGQVASLYALKVYGEFPGALIRITTLPLTV